MASKTISKPVRKRPVQRKEDLLTPKEIMALKEHVKYSFDEDIYKKVKTTKDLYKYILENSICESIDSEQLIHTCSMYELSLIGFVEGLSTIDGISPERYYKFLLDDFKKDVKEEISYTKYGVNGRGNRKIIRKTIVNCVKDSLADRLVVDTDLFKHIHTYKGSDGIINTYITK
jgi:hypothetical protein